VDYSKNICNIQAHLKRHRTAILQHYIIVIAIAWTLPI